MTEGTAGAWRVRTVDGAEVRLRSGRVGLMSVDVKAPVSGGELVIASGVAHLTLRMALDQLKTGNFLTQAAARTLVARHDATVLTYDGSGPAVSGGWAVSGHAVAGDVDVALDLVITGIGWLVLALAPANHWGVAAFGLALFAFGVGAVLIFINFLSLRQAVTPGPLLGRMTSTMRWLILIPAGPGALIGGWLAWDTISKRGPTIVVEFDSGSGLTPDQSQLKFQDVRMIGSNLRIVARPVK